MEEPRLMTDEELEYCKSFLEYFGVPIDGEFITLTSGGNSVICNPKTKWQKLLGCSVNGIAEAVAKKLNKPVKWEEEYY